MLTLRLRASDGLLFVFALGATFAACDTNCQQTGSNTPPACMPNTGDPAPDANGNCANIGGSPALRVCVNRCKKVVPLGQPCTNDLCNDGGNVCDAHLACLPDGGGGFKCANPATHNCDSSMSAVDNACQSGTFCKLLGTGACPGLNSNPPVTACAAWVSEGGTCDGNYSATTPLIGVCWPCEPGTICVMPNGSSTGVCKRACSAANQQASCPCDGFRCIVASASNPAGSYCEHCANSNLACAVQGGGTAPCCDPSAQCNSTTGNVCCRPNGTACSAASQCCAPPHASATCTAAGTCSFQCDAGWADCNHVAADGCETNLQTSNSNCASCGHACPAAPAGGSESCTAGVCGAHCPSGLSICSNTCVNLHSDTHNCGSCGHVCPAGPAGGSESCSNGTCTPTCPPGLSVCNNTCVNKQTNTSNCGSCGHACGANEVCSNGSCMVNCSPVGSLCPTTCCAPDTCITIPATGDIRCCHTIAQETGTCTN